jgi:hypothetical protein
MLMTVYFADWGMLLTFGGESRFVYPQFLSQLDPVFVIF